MLTWMYHHWATGQLLPSSQRYTEALVRYVKSETAQAVASIQDVITYCSRWAADDQQHSHGMILRFERILEF